MASKHHPPKRPKPRIDVHNGAQQVTLVVLVGRALMAAIVVMEARKSVEELRGVHVAQSASGKFLSETSYIVAHCGS